MNTTKLKILLQVFLLLSICCMLCACQTMPTGTAHWDEMIGDYREESAYTEIRNPTPDSEHESIWGGSDTSFQFHLSAWEYLGGKLVQTHKLKVDYATFMVSTFAAFLGRYQVMCGVSGDQWSVHVTVRDVETNEVITDSSLPVESI